jgi:hypothetical protein
MLKKAYQFCWITVTYCEGKRFNPTDLRILRYHYTSKIAGFLCACCTLGVSCPPRPQSEKLILYSVFPANVYCGNRPSKTLCKGES